MKQDMSLVMFLADSKEVMERLRLGAGGEWAFCDLREPGEAAEGHPFGSVNMPYSRLERDMMAKVPRLSLSRSIGLTAMRLTFLSSTKL